jgi:hypothetical protein
VAALMLAGIVEPAFFRAGAVAPGFGSSMVRPLVPHAVGEKASAAMASAARPRRRTLRVRWVDGVSLIGVRLCVWGFDAVPPLQRTGSVRPWLTAVCSQFTLIPTMKPPRAPPPSRSTRQRECEPYLSHAPEAKRATS